MPSRSITSYAFSEVRKTVAALLTGIATWGGTALADGEISSVEWFGLVGVVASVIAVFGVSNSAPPGEEDHPDVSEQPGY